MKKEIRVKIEEVKNEILSEKGSLLFSGIFFRSGLDEIGDFVVIADWVEEGDTREAVKYIIEKFKSKDLDYTNYTSNIVAFSTTDNFVNHLALAFKDNRIIDSDGETKLIKLFDDFIIRAIVLSDDFDDFEPSTISKKVLQKQRAF